MISSRPFVRPHNQRSFLLLFNSYRLFLAGILIFTYSLYVQTQQFPEQWDGVRFLIGSLCYAGLCTLALMASWRMRLTKNQVLLTLIADIILLTLILQSAGGVASGYGLIMLVSVAAGNLVLDLRRGLFLAAVACSAVVYSELLLNQYASTTLIQSALFGVALFALTGLLQYLAGRSRSHQRLAEERADLLVDLQRLNELIVQRMRTGIVVVDGQGRIKTINDAGCRLLTNAGLGELPPLAQLPEAVMQPLYLWLHGDSPHHNKPIHCHPDTPKVQLSFLALEKQKRAHSDILVFLEDTSKTAQQAQQMKLASLGHLTASIAHEIRNPLAAINHAAQLLEESNCLGVDDRPLLSIVQKHCARMNEIIENILQLSRRRPAHLELVSIDRLIDQALQLLQTGRVQKIEADIQLQQPVPKVRIDCSQILQVLDNLISNGLRYSQQRTGKMVIQIRGGILNSQQQPYIEIQDFGEGVAEDHKKHIFEPFFTTEVTGTGLGLYLSQELCISNQASLELVDNELPGCCFRITFAHHQKIGYE